MFCPLVGKYLPKKKKLRSCVPVLIDACRALGGSQTAKDESVCACLPKAFSSHV